MVFRWRKRNEGFEWRTYVRTTILVRRHERRQRAEDVKAAAVFGVKQAGIKGADAAGIALKSAQAGSLSALKWSGQRLAAGAQKSAAVMAAMAGKGAAGARASWVKGRAAAAPKLALASSAARAGASKAALKLEPAAELLRQPGLQLALKLIATVATAGALIRAWQFGWDGHALVALCIAAVAAGLLLATGIGQSSRAGLALRHAIDRVPLVLARLPGFGLLPRRGVVLIALGITALSGMAILGWQLRPHSWPGFAGLSKPSSARTLADPASTNSAANSQAAHDSSILEGTATAQAGDQLRISGMTIRLDGIEAPHRAQTCLKPSGKRWDCAATAREALSRLVKGHRISCKLSGTGSDDVRTGRCLAAETDLAAELVLKGHVFAQSGLFAAYSSQESQALAAKAGLWAGDVLRPADWRAARWEEAKRQAPDGCPIKGQVFRKSGKVYMLPWSPDYDRARVDKTQGERWFCSESEAVSAGWKKGL